MIGRIVGLHGVRGWVKVYSYTQPRENILSYTPWRLALNSGVTQTREVQMGRMQGKGVVVQLARCADRDAAAVLMDAEITVSPAQLAQTAPGEYYWKDLIGLAVENREAVPLGTVVSLMETGANDVLVVQGGSGGVDTNPDAAPVGERLIPYVPGVIVIEVDVAGGRIVVDWDADF